MEENFWTKPWNVRIFLNKTLKYKKIFEQNPEM